MLIRHDGLTVNVDAGRGECRVGLLDEAGIPIPGRTPDDMEPIRTDAVSQPLRWAGGASVAAWTGRWISLEIRLRDAELFAVRNETRREMP